MCDTEIKQKLIEPKRRASVDSKYATNHIGHKRWLIISRNIGNDIDLWRNMYDLGKRNLVPDNAYDATKKYMYCGEDVYISIRQDLISKGIVLNEPIVKNNNINTQVISNQISSGLTSVSQNLVKNKNKIISTNNGKKPLKKADKIKQDNILKKFKLDVDSLLKSISLEPIITDRAVIFNAKFVELMLVRMMVQCKNVASKLEILIKQLTLKESSKYTSREEIEKLQGLVQEQQKELIELIVGYNKIINEKQNNPLISKNCILDLIKWVDYAKRLTKFNATNVIINMPELIFKTVYDGMLEEKQSGLYQSQKDIFEFVTQNDKYLALVHTMLGSGKTSMVLPICGWLTTSRKSNRANGKSKLIFCCPNEVVLLEVAHMVYGMGVSFAIVIRNKNSNALEYKWSSFADKTNPKDSAVLYLCDIFVARLLLEERMRANESKKQYMNANRRDPANYPLTEQRIPGVSDYILMGDELTKDADSQVGFMVDSGFSVTSEVFVDLMKIAPPKIILMSATLPTAEQLPEFYDWIVRNNHGMIVKSFASSEAKIGCALISNTGELFAPHMGCETISDIEHILSVIKTNPFIGRFYTFEVLLRMVEIFTKLSLPVPELSIMFDNPNKANQTNIQQTAYVMLETLIGTGSNEIVKQACLLKKNVGAGVNLNTILTSDIGRFNKGCLVFSSDPVETATKVYQANFDNFLDSNAERNIFQQVRIDSILSKYQRELDLWKKALRRIEEKSDDGMIKQNKENDKKERIKSESWQVTAKMVEQKPIWDFPLALQLCSTEHLKKVKHYDNTGLGGMVCPDDLPETTSVSAEILTMLASGIGIYSTSSPMLDDDYLKTVLLLAKKGTVKFIFTDSSIAYGTNLAVSDIIMIDGPPMGIIQQGEQCTNATSAESIVDMHSISIVDMHSMKTIFQMLGRAGRGGNLSYEARIYTTSFENKLIEKIKSYAKGTLNEESKDEIINIRRAFNVLM